MEPDPEVAQLPFRPARCSHVWRGRVCRPPCGGARRTLGSCLSEVVYLNVEKRIRNSLQALLVVYFKVEITIRNSLQALLVVYFNVEMNNNNYVASSLVFQSEELGGLPRTQVLLDPADVPLHLAKAAGKHDVTLPFMCGLNYHFNNLRFKHLPSIQFKCF